MKDSVKNAMKRVTSCFLAVLLAVCLVGTPRTKAVVSEGAMLGSLFGSLLVSMGFSWAADNMDSSTFGESIYKLTQEFDEAMQGTGAQLIRDLSLAGLTATGSGKLQFGYQWVQAARSFAEWFQEKFFTGDITHAVVFDDSFSFTDTRDGRTIHFPYTVTGDCYSNMTYSFKCKLTKSGTYVISNKNINFTKPWYIYSLGFLDSGNNWITDDSGTVSPYVYYGDAKKDYYYTFTDSMIESGIYFHVTSGVKTSVSGNQTLALENNMVLTSSAYVASLTAEKPQEVHYPVVAEDGSQVYEITVDGVTATDIEGIIQGAVDRILAGTASIVGSVEQAGTGEEVANPEIDPYKVSLSSVFPFCIPFDVYNMVTMFVAEPEAPNATWTFTLPWSNQEYSVGWDLSDFDSVAQVCRSMELVLFAVGLAVITHKVIKW